MKKNLLMSLLAGAGAFAFAPASAQLSATDNPANYSNMPVAPLSIVQPSSNSVASVPCSTPVTSDVYVCDSGAVTLTASNGAAFAWFTGPTGGSPVASGSSFTTPMTTATTSYYLESYCNPDTTMMPLPAQAGTYSGDIRGYFFTAPVDFTIVGLRVPTDASTGAQTIEILRFNAGAPPSYPALTNSFTSLGYWNQVNTTTVINTNIQVNAGDVIGIYGWRAANNSYSAGGSYQSTIAGIPVTLERSGMQNNLDNMQMFDVWAEAGGSISRTEMYYSIYGDTSVRVMSTVHVNQSQSASVPVSICAGDSIFAQGAYQTVAGTYRDTLQTMAGCDSIISTILTVLQTHNVSVPVSICAGDSIFAEGAYQTISGTYRDTLQNMAGCDSIISTVLTVNALPAVTVAPFSSSSICFDDGAVALPAASPSGGSYTVNNVAVTVFDPAVHGAGTFYVVYTYQDANSCTASDSSAVNVNLSQSVSLPVSICAGDSIFAQGAYQTTSGTYQDTLVTVAGCDSIISTILTVNALPVVTVAPFSNDTVCFDDSAIVLPAGSPSGGSYTVNNVAVTAFDPAAHGAGTFYVVYTYQDANSCTVSDSTSVTVDLCTGVDEYNAAAMQVFPNPASDLITVRSGLSNVRVQLVDATGRIVAEEALNNYTAQLDLSVLAPAKGIYLVKLVSGKNVVSVKKLVRL